MILFLSSILIHVVAALVEALSAVVLVLLFLLQRFGTSRVSFLFSPIMGAWTLCTPLVGIYSIIHHYPTIFKALSPHYIFCFFWRNGKTGWVSLGGTVLCITGMSLTLLHARNLPFKDPKSTKLICVLNYMLVRP